ncbi:pyridoxal-phosphate dependent enzyme [Salibacterium salarium]|uniref:Pyridoxal-phosphate dependent enzyme n=1 Tax=Salibacterium salarium TaxID=284579 RepID=A0A428N6B4_9BACI|nr:threonine synthase [Salibacterium salarium]RSL33951.1 pyridoxal-phosphate dependent enzyme [Salibacterium salarium]
MSSYNFYDSISREKYTPDVNQWKPKVGLFNMEPYPVDFPMENIIKRQASMWRYEEALPIHKKEPTISLGEGMTPLIVLDDKNPHFLVKMDYLMPTGSFKDRGAAMLMAKAKEMGAQSVIADSSGNAGTSIAAYCARANIECHVYTPSSTSEKKLAQIKAHGAQLHLIPGTREQTAVAAKEAVEKEGIFYASHVYNPYFYEGTKTFAFEIWEQLHYTAPDTLILPVGNGTLLLGAYIGFNDLKRAGAIQKMPKIIGVQSEHCAPIEKAYRENISVSSVDNKGTKAEGIAIGYPPRGDQIIEAVKHTNGTIIIAPENQIETAGKDLANKGFYVEPTTAATYAAYRNYEQNIAKTETVVMPLCGSGLKK